MHLKLVKGPVKDGRIMLPSGREISQFYRHNCVHALEHLMPIWAENVGCFKVFKHIWTLKYY